MIINNTNIICNKVFKLKLKINKKIKNLINFFN